MNFNLCFSGRSSELVSSFYPHLQLKDGQYEIGLVDVEVANTVANLSQKNNKFYYQEGSNLKNIVIPPGCYEVDAIGSIIQTQLPSVKMTSNSNTMKVQFSSPYDLDFSKKDSIGSLLGFSPKVYKASSLIESDMVVDIFPLSVIRVECNLVSNSYVNGVAGHVLFQFPVTVDPGYRLAVTPQSVIYLPINRDVIDTITLRFVDQHGDLIDFRGEKLSARLHLRKV